MPSKRPLNHCYEYPRPAVTADAVVWSFGDEGWRILLIERKTQPFAGRWALPGGFVNPDEPPLEASIRELYEETNVAALDFRDVGPFGDKGRDPRGWTISYAFYTLLPQGSVNARAGDDASHTAWHRMDELPKLAFDHDKIIEKAKQRLAIDLYTTPIARPFLSRTFSASEAGKFVRALDANAPRTGKNIVERLTAFGLVKRTTSGDWRFIR
jgi:8-oxo-dGTP diphosphatase